MDSEPAIVRISERSFGSLPDGRTVELYTLRNAGGMEVDIMNYGGVITRLTAPAADGTFADVVLGFDNLDAYLAGNPFFGTLVGRYGNRIAGGKFSLDGTEYSLAKNNGENHLHGGPDGLDKALWSASTDSTSNSASLILRYTSPDGESGYPGNLTTIVTYTLTDGNALDVSYRAETDKPTIVNLTQHSYFNLSGNLSSPILDHELTLDADAFLPVDSGLIPTGELRPVAGTPFDFREPKAIGAEIDAENQQLTAGGGYDHCWVLNGAGFRRIARARHPGTGRILEVFSDQPGVQFYTGNFLDGSLAAKGGGTYVKRSGFCLETQHYPDSPNQPDFPSVRLDPGEVYQTRTQFKFSAE